MSIAAGKCMRCCSPNADWPLPAALGAAALLLPPPNAESRPGGRVGSCRVAWPSLWRSCAQEQIATVGQRTSSSIFVSRFVSVVTPVHSRAR